MAGLRVHEAEEAGEEDVKEEVDPWLEWALARSRKKETRASLPEEEYDGVELDRAGVELEHGVGDGYGVERLTLQRLDEEEGGMETGETLVRRSMIYRR